MAVKMEKDSVRLPPGRLSKQRNAVSGAEPGMRAFLVAATRWQQGLLIVSLPSTAFAFTSRNLDGLSSIKQFREFTNLALFARGFAER